MCGLAADAGLTLMLVSRPLNRIACFGNTTTTPLGVAVSDRIAVSLSRAHPAISAAMQNANKIDEQMNSALEKAKQDLDAANTGMWLGVVGSLISGADAGASGTASQHSDHVEATPSPLSLARMNPAGGLHAAAVGAIDVQPEAKASESLQHSTTKDHASRVRDAITDLLRKMSATSDASRALGRD